MRKREQHLQERQKKKILYYLQIDWDWIKQRPQLLAEELGDEFDVHVVYRRSYHRGNLQDNVARNVTLHPFYTLPPCRDRFKWLTKINSGIRRFKITQITRNQKPDLIWLTYPSQIRELAAHTDAKVIYDCMDDQLLLECPAAYKDSLRGYEKELCERAAIIFVSSEQLRRTLIARYRVDDEKIVLVRNGHRVKGESKHIFTGDDAQHLRVGYIGTIAEWFDFSLIVESLDRFPWLEYTLIGPVMKGDVPQHPRINYRGTVAHECLSDEVKGVDVLVMPFKEEDLVYAVDPVKIYEYIGFRKNIICLDYPETRRFSEFAYLYRGTESYCKALQECFEKRELRYTDESAALFLQENTWSRRKELVCEAIKRLDI